MKSLKFRIGAIGTGALLATVTALGAVALQSDEGSSGGGAAGGGDSEIVYTGGYGLFPVGE